MEKGRCTYCGAAFAVATRGRPRRYCGRACQARAYRERRDGGRVRRTRARVVASSAGLAPAVIVRDAMALADADGLDAVSMRVLAARNGVAVMTVYRHVASRERLVSAMVDAAVADLADRIAARPDGWRARLAHEANQEWELYRRHPWTLTALATMRPPLGQPVLDSIDRVMSALTDEGLDASTALSVYLLVSGFVQGMALVEVAESAAVCDTGVTATSWWSAQLGRLAGAVGTGWYPWLADLAAHTPPGVVDPRRWFDFGLDRVLDGIGTLIERPLC